MKRHVVMTMLVGMALVVTPVPSSVQGPAQAAPGVSPALAYQTLTAATRPFDSRVATSGRPAGTIDAGTTIDIDLGITDPTVRAAYVNLTMVEPDGSGFLVASNNFFIRPPTSNLNAVTGEIVANAAIVPVDDRGHIAVFSSVTTDVIVDVMGVFMERADGEAGDRYTPANPTRLIDTREPVTTANEFTSFAGPHLRFLSAPAGGRAGIPATARAVALTVTGLAGAEPTAGYVTVHPGGTPLPPTSNLNVNGSGDMRANLVIVPLGADGSIDLFLKDTADVVVDVLGYFTETTTLSGSYHVIAPDRQVDTRIIRGFGRLRANGGGSFIVAGDVPTTAMVISQNLTITDNDAAGWLRSLPAGLGPPQVTNVNASGPGQNRAALAFTQVGDAIRERRIAYFSSMSTDLVVDVTGYFD